MGEVDRAIAIFRRYLEEAPDAADREAVEQRIVELEASEAGIDRDEGEPPSRDTEPPAPDAGDGEDVGLGRTLLFPLLVSGAGLLVLGGGVVLGALSSNAHQEAVDDPDFMSAHASQESAENLALSANILFAVGGAVLVAGAVWAIVRLVRYRRAERRPSVSLAY